MNGSGFANDHSIGPGAGCGQARLFIPSVDGTNSRHGLAVASEQPGMNEGATPLWMQMP